MLSGDRNVMLIYKLFSLAIFLMLDCLLSVVCVYCCMLILIVFGFHTMHTALGGHYDGK